MRFFSSKDTDKTYFREGDVRENSCNPHNHNNTIIFTNLSSPVHPNNSASGLMSRGNKDGLIAHTVHVDGGGRNDVEHVEVTELGDHVGDLVLVAHL